MSVLWETPQSTIRQTSVDPTYSRTSSPSFDMQDSAFVRRGSSQKFYLYHTVFLYVSGSRTSSLIPLLSKLTELVDIHKIQPFDLQKGSNCSLINLVIHIPVGLTCPALRSFKSTRLKTRLTFVLTTANSLVFNYTYKVQSI
ncbi:hypothetical protein OCU04_007024 [Sclerotinia nivalis]|uniref:Uncharacterized protein n=1 Tax=Sclerotinia nivalis TaxID=352851 RepID=A0A9X0ALV8_9HELO|nr:hypothetical protein OCU04_007024 [Sclerotinia nivalis]